MNTEYDTEMEMEVLYDQIEDAVEFATNENQPYSSAQIEHIAYNIVFKTVLINFPYRKWKSNLHSTACRSVLKFTPV